MCSRYTLISAPEEIAALFGLAEVEGFPPRYNIAPTQPVAVARVGYGGGRELALVRWGLVPGWVKEPGDFSTLINARAETLAEKPSFKTAYKHRRCLFPMNGFYEWSGAKGHKTPHYFHQADGRPFAVAGLWEHWMNADGSELETAAIITVAPNKELARIHSRMPAIMPPEGYGDWLNCRDIRPREVKGLLRPAPDGFLVGASVSQKVNSPSHDGPELLRPDDDPDDPDDFGLLL